MSHPHAKSCEFVLHRGFSYPVEVFSSSERVTISIKPLFSCPVEILSISKRVTSSSIYQHQQRFQLIKESIQAVSIVHNKNNKANCKQIF
jgi:hypothetical protein